MAKTYYGVEIISDIHFGAFDSEILMSELQNNFLNHLRKQMILHMIVITGDLFHTKLSLNSSNSKLCFYFIKEIVNISRERNAKIRIVKGTSSHDNDQLENLRVFCGKDVDIKIINTVTEEQIYHNLKVLYIPEEYVDTNEHYKDFFNKDNEYDMIFGHGLIKEATFCATEQESAITMKKAPVFDTEILLKICKGPIFFGHIHTHKVYKNRFFYVGSFSRWTFGETEDKGYMSCFYSPTDSSFVPLFIKNEDARSFDTMELSVKKENHIDIVSWVNDLVDTINNVIIDYMRIKIVINDNMEESKLLINLINETFANNKKVKVTIVNKTEAIKQKESDEKLNLLIEKYGFIFDSGISYEDKISKFVKLMYNKDISPDKIKDKIFKKINK